MGSISGNKREALVVAINTDTAITLAHHQRVLDVTAGVGGDVTIVVPAAGSLPDGFECVVRRNPASANNVILSTGVSRTLTEDGEGVILVADSGGWIYYPTVGPVGTPGTPGADGADGADGAPGPNQVTTATDCNITGLLKGDGSKVAAASLADVPINGGTDIGEALADTDEIAVHNASTGAVRKSAVSRLWTYIWGKITALAAKATPVDADSLITVDSEDGNTGKLTTWTQAKAFLKTYFDTLYAPSAHTHNLCLTPGFETQLYGAHTTAITRINAASTTRNLSLPGWQWVSGTGSPDATVTQETATVQTTNSRASCKVDIAGLGTSNPRLRQIWNATHWLESLVYQVRGKYLTFAVDLKLSAGTANAARAFITTDGTGGTTTYSSYKANDTNWERLIVSVAIPADATSIEFGVYFENATPDYYLDNCMCVCSDAALLACAFTPRLPVSINSQGSNFVDVVNQFVWTNATGTTCVTGSGGADTDYNINTNRPHWATKTELMLNALSGTVATMGVRPNGAAVTYSFQYPTNKIIFAPCPIGQDGQLLFHRENTDGDMYVSFKNWVGEGL